MKKFLLTVMFSFFAIFATAQQEKIVVYTVPFVPEHDIRLSVGLVPITMGTSMSDYKGDYDNNYKEENRFKTCSINLSYSYRTKRWLDVGVMLSYNGSYKGGAAYGPNVYGAWRTDITDISVLPMVRFSWYRSKLIRLYSSIGVGITLSSVRETFNESVVNETRPQFASHVTLFGVSAGKRLFGFAEVGGLGSAGMAIFGIGYRFIDKKTVTL